MRRFTQRTIDRVRGADESALLDRLNLRDKRRVENPKPKRKREATADFVRIFCRGCHYQIVGHVPWLAEEARRLGGSLAEMMERCPYCRVDALAIEPAPRPSRYPWDAIGSSGHSGRGPKARAKRIRRVA